MKRICLIFLLLALVLAMPAAQAHQDRLYTNGDYAYILLPDGTAEITAYTGQAHALQIPAALDGHAVSAIGDQAFKGNLSLSCVHIPGSVSRIGTEAFLNCDALISVSIGEHIAYVDYEDTLSEKQLLSFIAIGMGAPDMGYGTASAKESLASAYQPIRAMRTPLQGDPVKSRGTTTYTMTYPSRIDSFLASGFSFRTISQDELDQILAWEQQTGRELLCPIPSDLNQSTANVWYKANARGQITDAYKPELTLTAQYRTDASGAPARWRAISGGYTVRVLNAVWYAYKYGFDPVYPTTDNPIFTPSAAVPAADGLVIEQSAFPYTSLCVISLPENVQQFQSIPFSMLGSVRYIVPYGSSAEAEIVFNTSNIQNILYPDAPAASAEIVSGSFTYVLLPDGTAKITYCADQKAAMLDIPETLDGHRVTAVSPKALRDCSELAVVSLPSGVTDFGGAQLSGLGSLTAIHVAQDNPVLTSVNGVLIDKTTSTLLFCPEAYPIPEYTVPDFIRHIGGGAFRWGASMKIILPEGLETVGPLAFFWHYCLTELHFPDTVTAIGPGAINWCNSLTTVRLPRDLTVITAYNLTSCDQLSSITYPAALQEIGRNVLRACPRLTSIGSLPGTLRSIGSGSFAGCGSLTSVRLPDGLVSLGDETFMNCYRLESVSLPASLESVGVNAFFYCESLTTVEFRTGGSGMLGKLLGNLFKAGNKLTISTGAFSSCSSLRSVTLPAHVTSIEPGAFSKANLDPRMILGETVFTVEPGSYAMQWCRDNGYEWSVE